MKTFDMQSSPLSLKLPHLVSKYSEEFVLQRPKTLFA
jgi:hypothetical protein